MYTRVQFSSPKYAKQDYKIRKNQDEFSNVTFKLENDSITYDGPRLDGHDSYGDSDIFLAVGAKTSFTNLLEDNKFYDVKLKIIDNGKEHIRKLHKIILVNMTDFFDVAFSGVKKREKISVNIEEAIDLFDKLIDIIYGKVTRIHGVEGLRILQLMDKYGVKFNQYVKKEFDLEDYIGEMGMPGKKEVIRYFETLNDIFPNINTVTDKVYFHISQIVDFYIDEDTDIIPSIRQYLPKELLKRIYASEEYNENNYEDND